MTVPNESQHKSDASVNPGKGSFKAPPVRVGAGDTNDDDVMVDRPDDEDHDLLTFGEAGARLEEELIKQRRLIERLRSTDADSATILTAEKRLEAIERASTRNRAPSLDDLKSSGFFGPRS